MKAFTVDPEAKIHVYDQSVSMSFGFPKLMDLSSKVIKRPEDKKDLVVFTNKKANYIKIIFYAKGGWCILAKRLEAGKFDVESVKSKLDFAALHEFVDQIIIGDRKKTRHLKAA